MDFGEVLSRAWNIIWKHKILWFFGFLAALGGGSGNGGGGGSGMNFRFNDRDLPNLGNGNWENLPQWMQRVFDTVPVWLPFLLILFILGLIVVIVILSTFGRIGLTRGAWLADEGEQRLSLGQLWGYGMRYFWRVLLLSLLLMAVGFIAAIIIAIPAIGIAIVTLGVGLICLLPLLCLLGLAAPLLGVIFDMAAVSIVNEDLSITDGLSRSWNVFKSHLGQIIGMALILWIGSLIVGFVLGLPLLLIVAPIIASLIFQSQAALNSSLLLSLVLFLLYLPVLLLAQGIIQSYIGTSWTLVFRRLTGRPAIAG